MSRMSGCPLNTRWRGGGEGETISHNKRARTRMIIQVKPHLTTEQWSLVLRWLFGSQVWHIALVCIQELYCIKTGFDLMMVTLPIKVGAAGVGWLAIHAPFLVTSRHKRNKINKVQIQLKSSQAGGGLLLRMVRPGGWGRRSKMDISRTLDALHHPISLLWPPLSSRHSHNRFNSKST